MIPLRIGSELKYYKYHMYQLPSLLKFPSLVHGFSTVDEGNMSFKFGNKKQVINNRKKFLGKLDISIDDCVASWVTHGDIVVVADEKLKGISMWDYKKAVRVDGLVTAQKGLFLFLLIADCLPVILYDPKKEVIGVVHVGWKGADINIANEAIKKLGDKYRVEPSNLVVGFGPAALKDSFIKESPSQIDDPMWQVFLEEVGNDKYKVDFVGLCKKQLLNAGIKENNILESGIDTVKDKRFFSHHRDSGKDLRKQGRFACVVGIKK
jgi:YfiH family protein